MKEEFKEVSIRGRVGFAILCFESFIEIQDSSNLQEWKYLLKKLWEFTKLKFVDDWLDLVSAVMPLSVLEDPFDPEEVITIDEYSFLKKLYARSDPKILELIEFIFKLATVELYSEIKNYSPRTLDLLNDIIGVCKSANVKIPDVSLFKKFSITDSSGWGFPFDRSDVFK
ncbi:hypothetical protein [Reichenbachiella versicolor]|uniref:hypothetical protein n=1 Tax=Reichenbachiella versicolor TaxID=1821036 RepID=UPI000D6E625F|nr:hypothetical protein [Reichenbachiella versicolor]